MTALLEELVPDELWAVVESLLPPPPSLVGGQVAPILARNCFAAIVYMARTSTSWRLLPAQALGCGEVGVQGLGGIPVAAAPVGQLPSATGRARASPSARVSRPARCSASSRVPASLSSLNG